MKKMQSKWYSLLNVHDLAEYWPHQIELHQDFDTLIIMLKEKKDPIHEAMMSGNR